MKISIEREPFVDALGRMVPIAAGRSPLPILSNVYLRTVQDDAGGHVALDVSDLEVAMKIKLSSCEVTEPGGVCLDAKKLFEIAKAIPGGLIEVASNELSRTTISSGNSHFNLNGLSGDEFPRWDPGDGDMTITVPKLTLASAIQKTVFATAQDDSRFNLNAVLWEVKDGDMKFVATDGHRLGIVHKVALALADDIRMLVPRKAMLAIRKFIEKTDSPIDIQVSKKFIVITTDNSTLGCRLIDGDYPDYLKVIPSSAGQPVTTDRIALSKSLSMVRLMTSDRNRGVMMDIQPGRMVIRADHPDMGTAEDSLSVDYDGPPIELIANVEYLIDGLGVIETEQVKLEYFKEGAPVIFRPVGCIGDFNLVMPMRK
jgi:DNA polymerase-3 subunit beta